MNIHSQVPKGALCKETQTETSPTDSRKRRCLQPPSVTQSTAPEHASAQDTELADPEAHSGDEDGILSIEEPLEVASEQPEHQLHDTLAKPMSQNELAQVCSGASAAI